MQTVTVAEAKVQLSRLIAMVEAGEDVAISKRGQVVARIIRHPPQRQQIPSMASLRAKLPMQAESSGALVRRMRETDRY